MATTHFTFPMHQRLRKTNPYAYYSLTAQKQMQSALQHTGDLAGEALQDPRSTF